MMTKTSTTGQDRPTAPSAEEGSAGVDQPARRGPGRPRLCAEELRVVAFKLPVSTAASFDEMLKALGETRSTRLRALVENDLAAFASSAEAAES